MSLGNAQVSRASTLWQRLIVQMAALDVFDTTRALTLITVLLYGSSHWYLRIPLMLVGTLGLVFRGARKGELLWFFALVSMLAANAVDWYSIDNHKYLFGYWLIVIYLCSLLKSPGRVLALNAKFLISATFGLAVLWKLLSPDFLSGNFLYYELLTDARLASVSKYIGGAQELSLIHNDERLDALNALEPPRAPLKLNAEPNLLALAKFLSYLTIFAEAAIALLFLLPNRIKLGKHLKHAALVGFIFVTYAMLPVYGFGSILSVMGFAQCERRDRLWRLFYLSAFLFMFIYSAPAKDILAWVFGR